MAKHRLYSIPYNGTKPDWYISEVLKRKEHIDHVFCELPYLEMLSHVRFLFKGKNNEESDTYDFNNRRAKYISNCIDFLRLSAGLFRRFCPINAMYYAFKNEYEMEDFIINILRVVDEFKVDGLIISDYRIALLIRQYKPDIEIHTSCNGYQWTLRQMRIWRDNIGVKYFNPPREILRKHSALKDMHDAGFKLKCIINESCLFGCAFSFCHQMSISLNCFGGSSCIQTGFADLFKSNWILPRWQKFYDKYVDIYKIAGRNSTGDYPFRTLDAYITENNSMNLIDLIISGTSTYFSKESVPNLTLDKIPDKLMTCECRDCDNCHLCEKVLSLYIEPDCRSYLEKVLMK